MFVAINTSDTEHVGNRPAQPVAETQAKGEGARTYGNEADIEASYSKDSSAKLGDGGGLGVPASPPMATASNTKQVPTLAVETIRLSAEQLAPFGLTYTRGRIAYVEDAVRVTIGGDGVSTKNDSEAKDVATLAPVMVVVYHDEKHYSSLWDKADTNLRRAYNNRAASIRMSQTSLVDGLVAIRVPLDASGTLASKADVVLWFAGTKELAERLPDPYKTALLRELGIVNGSTTTHYTEPDLGRSTLVEASLVFPNPLRNGMASVRLVIKRSAVSTGIVTDMFGKEIAVAWKSQSVDAGQTDLKLFGLENAPTGVYNVVITFEGSTERIVQRLMIQR